MSTEKEDIARLLPITMRSLVHLVAVEMHKSGLDLSIPQFGILDFLLANKQVVQTDLANHFFKDKSVVLRQLDDMEKAGWIERQLDPNDRRRKNLVVTPAGLAAHALGDTHRNEVFARALAGISKQELSACLNVLTIMNDRANGTETK